MTEIPPMRCERIEIEFAPLSLCVCVNTIFFSNSEFIYHRFVRIFSFRCHVLMITLKMHTFPLYTWTSTSIIVQFVGLCVRVSKRLCRFLASFFVPKKQLPYNYASFGTESKKTNFGQITNILIYMWNFPEISTQTIETYE